MKNGKIYIVLIVATILLDVVPVMAISNEEYTRYVKLSDIGINIPSEEDI